MKKLICVFLSVMLFFSAFTVLTFAVDYDSLKFAVASDLHYRVTETKLEKTNNDPIFWYANRRCAMESESSFIIDELLNQCTEDDSIDYLLIPGDLADDGRRRPEDHYAMAKKLYEFEKKSGKEVFIINGNHDCSDDSLTTRELFKEIYADFGYDKAVTVKGGDDCSYTADLNDKYRLIALDSNHAVASTEDGFSAETLKWVKNQTDSAKKDGKYPILMMHHNLLDHLPVQRVLSRNFIVKFHYTTAELFADWGIKLVLTGHEHCSDAAVFTSALGNKIYDLTTTSLTMYPLEYRVISLTDKEISYGTRKIEKIDYNALRAFADGYTDEMLEAMKADMTEYSKGFLKAGVQYRLERSLSPEKLGISEDALYYNAVMYAVNKLKNLLSMPLYGDESLSSVAEQYSIELPKTQYKNGWDIATELVAQHYSGEESFDLESAEIKLFLRAIATVLRSELSGVADDVILKAANNFLAEQGYAGIADTLIKASIERYGVYSSSELFVVAIASPIIYEFTYDDDGVNDNNGVIEGYGCSDIKTNISNIADNIRSLSKKLSLYITTMLSIIIKNL